MSVEHGLVMVLEERDCEHLHKQCTAKVPPSDVAGITHLLSIQTPREEVSPVVVLFPLVVLDFITDTKRAISHRGKRMQMATYSS